MIRLDVNGTMLEVIALTRNELRSNGISLADAEFARLKISVVIRIVRAASIR